MNKMVFNMNKPEEEQACLKFIASLLDLNKSITDMYNEMHIWHDGLCTIIEWEQVPYSKEYGGEFKYIDEDHIVMYEGIFPDNSYEYFYDEDEYKEKLNEWLKDHPTWHKNEYDIWSEM